MHRADAICGPSWSSRLTSRSREQSQSVGHRERNHLVATRGVVLPPEEQRVLEVTLASRNEGLPGLRPGVATGELVPQIGVRQRCRIGGQVIHVERLGQVHHVTRVTVTAHDLAPERACTAESCEITVAAIDSREPGVSPVSTPLQWSLDTPLTIHRLGRWRILEGERHQATGPAPHAVFDVDHGRLVNLTVRDVADWFGPPLAAVALLLLAIAAVSASLWVPAATPLIWRRLGAREATTTDTLEEAIARRSMHVAVVLVASLPLLACAVVGLVV